MPQSLKPPADDSLPAVSGVPPFAVDVLSHAPGVLLARVRGDLDYLVAPILRRRLLERLGSAVPLLIIDLSAVTLLSAAAIQTLLTVHQMAPRHGVDVRLVGGGRAVLRPLQITGVDAQLRLHPTLDEAAHDA